MFPQFRGEVTKWPVIVRGKLLNFMDWGVLLDAVVLHDPECGPLDAAGTAGVISSVSLMFAEPPCREREHLGGRTLCTQGPAV